MKKCLGQCLIYITFEYGTYFPFHQEYLEIKRLKNHWSLRRAGNILYSQQQEKKELLIYIERS